MNQSSCQMGHLTQPNGQDLEGQNNNGSGSPKVIWATSKSNRDAVPQWQADQVNSPAPHLTATGEEEFWVIQKLS